MADEPNAVDLVKGSLDVAETIIKWTCRGSSNVTQVEGGYAHATPPGFSGALEGGTQKSWQMLHSAHDEFKVGWDWHMTCTWEWGKQVKTADKGLWGAFIENATVQVAAPSASLHLRWDYTIHFPGQGSWVSTDTGLVQLDFAVDIKCFETTIVDTPYGMYSYAGYIRGDGSGKITPT
jgi:hypothetical protein